MKIIWKSLKYLIISLAGYIPTRLPSGRPEFNPPPATLRVMTCLLDTGMMSVVKPWKLNNIKYRADFYN